MTRTNSTDITENSDTIYDNLCKLYGEYFNHVREHNGLSLRELSRQTNVSVALISLLENGDKLPRIETLIRLTLALGIPFDEIFGHKAAGLDFKSKPVTKLSPKREDEALRNILLKMGFGKDEMKDILEFIDYKKFRKAVSRKMPPKRSN